MLLSILEQACLSFFGTVAFSTILNVPKRALIYCGLTGTSGWMTYKFFMYLFNEIIVANFMAAIVIGILYMQLSRRLRIPVIILNTPAILPLVPGNAAYLFVRYAVEGDYVASVQHLMTVFKVSGAIVFGFMFISLAEQQIRRQRQERARRQLKKKAAKAAQHEQSKKRLPLPKTPKFKIKNRTSKD
ncbi:threonine/serine exporter family protein [Aerococcus sanguinicola]|uniref:Threonine/serine exporter n=1 Tax=Aerococcus sanguinicola TaxID=119206 RepID=A0A0X8FAD3_9LACT|nr:MULTISPECIES: threonine/serine exporter family protein [Aerococcus]AMB93725.1 hypothetical protein AWM72_02645 [Aerococcus sanguinicola]MDK7050427.1 threonine/serine exporter family protein [Aerococcus sanguinicola]OFT94518.1 hypothetical protein HMPREF3090_05495 [Aerococcus sp. HMSC23C02]PKZ21545.1 threonine/serine exporter [Aerococcus sanguinicola]